MIQDQPNVSIRTLWLEVVHGFGQYGPQYAYWRDAEGRSIFCMVGLGVRGVERRFKARVGETWSVRCLDIDPTGRAFGFGGLVELVRPDPMRLPQSTEPVFLPPAVRTKNNALHFATAP